MRNGKQKKQFVVCTYRCSDEDLQFGKIYLAIPDKESEKAGMLRIIDESGEDYLYLQKYFASVHLSNIAKAAFANKG